MPLVYFTLPTGSRLRKWLTMKVNDTVRIKQIGDYPRHVRATVVHVSPCGRFARVKKNIGVYGNQYQYIVNEYRVQDLEVLK